MDFSLCATFLSPNSSAGGRSGGIIPLSITNARNQEPKLFAKFMKAQVRFPCSKIEPYESYDSHGSISEQNKKHLCLMNFSQLCYITLVLNFFDKHETGALLLRISSMGDIFSFSRTFLGPGTFLRPF